ncbi:sugar phosphate isomerase/epimerase family protein [Paenibacillus sp. YPG26]|uniref:sugar phosphate isomerase/epimerase family protein n=1 Tax=Paenibacillus sp. YPG26 TaxID=2878915 RepID=UPI00203B2549|nr:sugar phosphate isomerase/epimerase family protein [Paenibacillus sp. YPG26]USB34387.1 sugar phosphate isomerase/epimerase [Paenibacillus sp. YPG26]
MILTLNPVTTGGAFLEFLDAASGAGFPAIEYDIRPFAEIAEKQSLEAARELLSSRNLVLGCIGLPVEFRRSEEEFEQELAELPRLAAFARELGVERCCTWLMPTTDEPVAEYTCRTVVRLRKCAQILGAQGIRFGLEWVGPKTLRTQKYDFIHDLRGALDLIDAIGEPNVGLLFDSFHWFTSGGTAQDILNLRSEQIVLVHMNDAPNEPVDEQLDQVRLLPGEGIIDLAAMFESLGRIGYDSYVSVETFGKELPALGAKEAAVRTKAAADKTLHALKNT